MVQECVYSKCMPTLIVYEMNNETYGSVNRRGDALFINSQKIEDLQIQAMEQDSYLDGMMGDESFLQKQQDLMEMFKKENNSGASNSQ